MLPTYHDDEGEEVARPDGEEAGPRFKNELFDAIEANLETARKEELAMGDMEEAARIKKEEGDVEKEKDSE